MEFCNPNSLHNCKRGSWFGGLLVDSGDQEMAPNWGVGDQGVTRSRWCGCRPLDGTMGTSKGSVSIGEADNTTVREFRQNVEKEDMVWLQKIKKEAVTTFSRGSGHGSPKSSQYSCQLLQNKDNLEKLVPVVSENRSVPCGTQSQAAVVPSVPASPTLFPKMSGNLPSSGKLVPIMESFVQRAAEC
ncbi:uncharacterized protein [Notamacropus eugenii]|uniref:uncharacterized protein isoform X3 n=1 Tax=Notamacropus eugenii TaxID=9315 RepID=UPI003B6760A0